mmetsp:Transcript_23633/g.41883  ORF Transcript_23633/g.41883 Transcript_23633/m.41883 type:complete len:133 (+) Transcript_23633:2992-3390(+)
MVYSFFIINRFGSLLFDRIVRSSSSSSDENYRIMMSSTLHSLHAISAILTPEGMSREGLSVINAQLFKLTVFQTPTGMKLCLVGEATQTDAESLLRRAYEVYADFVMKNPLYVNDQPIRFEAFEREIDRIFT